MSDSRRWGALATSLAAVTALAVLGVARWQEGRFARFTAVSVARSTAAYLAVVTPPPVARGGGDSPPADYDLGQLLAQSRALATLPGWVFPVEVYHATAPLVDAAAAPLPAAELARADPRWLEGSALVPLAGPGEGPVVGIVAVRPRRHSFLLAWGFPAALLAVGAAAGCALRGWPRRHYAAAALLLGVAAYADVRGAARRSTDQWLDATRLLVQEAATRLPGPRTRVTVADLAPVAPGAELVVTDSGTQAPRRIRVAGVTRGVIAARVGSGRWVALRTTPAEGFTSSWLVVLVGLALLGPFAFSAIDWLERKGGERRALRQAVAAWGFLAPAGLHLAVFSVGPILFALYLSVHASSGGLGAVRPYVGMANYTAVLRDPLLWVSLRHTVLYALSVPVSMMLALLLALVLQRPGRVAATLRAVLVLPYLSSLVAVALVWQAFLGLAPPPWDWLATERMALLAVIVLSIWIQVGYQMLVFVAGLGRVPQVYLDAARVDGANAWQRFWRVTFPLLRPTTLFVFVTGVIGAFQVFTLVYVLTGGGPLGASDVVARRLYQVGWESLEFGRAAALSVLVTLLLLVFTWTQLKLLRGERGVEYA